tara:strand:- start:18615 stop:20570 length:1956 start_codon:yes stop_codon:yes gene_type:complete
MSMLNRKEFKTLLSEWSQSFNNKLLLEIKISELESVIGTDNLNKLAKSKAFKDQLFLQVVKNTFINKEGHEIEDILGIYDDYSLHIKKDWTKNKIAKIDIPGGLRTEIFPKTSSYDTISEFISAKKEFNLSSKSYIECLENSSFNTGSTNKDFDVVVNSSEWIICYPKSPAGSIALSRSYYDNLEDRLIYDKTSSGRNKGEEIGMIRWCTSNFGGGNMFLNYYRHKNLHMYYCIKKSFIKEDPNKKICISLEKQNNKINFSEGSASVDSLNNRLSEQDCKEIIGSLYSLCIKDASDIKRKEVDYKSYYESINLTQYRNQRVAADDNLIDFIKEFKGIIQHSRDKDLIHKEAISDVSPIIRKALISSNNALSRDTIQYLIDTDDDYEVRYRIALMSNCPIEFTLSLFKNEEFRSHELFDEEILLNLAISILKIENINLLDNNTKEEIKDILKEGIEEETLYDIFELIEEIHRNKEPSKNIWNFLFDEVIDLSEQHISYADISMLLRFENIDDNSLEEAFNSFSSNLEDLSAFPLVLSHEKFPDYLYEKVFNMCLEYSNSQNNFLDKSVMFVLGGIDLIPILTRIANSKKTPTNVLIKMSKIKNKSFKDIVNSAKDNYKKRFPREQLVTNQDVLEVQSESIIKKYIRSFLIES